MGICSSKKSKMSLNSLDTISNTLSTNLVNQDKSLPINLIRTTSYDVSQVYNILPQIIGQGHFGSIRICTRKLAFEKKYAIKSIFKSKVSGKQNLLEREVEILNKIDHPNIIKFFGSFENDKQFHIIMEYCEGGDLLERIINTNGIPEKEATQIIINIIGALNFLHENGICHRDLKPENFMYSENQNLKMIDFGLSRKFYSNNESNKYDIVTSQGSNLKSLVGTPLYIAPEVLKAKYDQRCDLWSLGVLTYVILSAQPPFYGSTNQELFSKINKGEYSLNTQEWKHVSSDAKDFIKKLIVIDVNNRMSLEEAANHPWLNQFDKKQKNIQQNVSVNIIDLLTCLHSYCSFKKILVRSIADNLQYEEVEQINNYLNQKDPKRLGIFNIKQVIQMFASNQEEQERAILLVESKGFDMQLKLSFSYIRVAILESQKTISEVALVSAFKSIDIENKGILDEKSLIEYLKIKYQDCSESEIRNIINIYDKDKDGFIGWNDFTSIFGHEDIHGNENILMKYQ